MNRSFSAPTSFGYRNTTPANGLYSVGVATRNWRPGYNTLDLPSVSLSSSGPLTSSSINSINVTSGLFASQLLASPYWGVLSNVVTAGYYTQAAGTHTFGYAFNYSTPYGAAAMQPLMTISNSGVVFYGAFLTTRVPQQNTSNFSPATTDFCTTFFYSGTMYWNAPSASLWPGRVFIFKQGAPSGSGYTIVCNSAVVVPLNSTTPGTAILGASNTSCMLISDGTYWQIMMMN